MTWAKIDDRWPRHPKAVAAGPLGRDLYICGLCYCNEHLTDGFIPRTALSTLSPGLQNPSRTARRLVELGLWETATRPRDDTDATAARPLRDRAATRTGSHRDRRTTRDGFIVHDYHDYNATASDVKEKLNARKLRQQRWRERNRDASRNAEGDASATRNQRRGGDDAHSSPLLSTPIPPISPPRARSRRRAALDDPAALDWLELLNREAGSAFTATLANLKPIRARLRDGFKLEQAETVVRDRVTKWRGTEWAEYLRPETVFGGKFDSYLHAASNGKPVDPYQDFPRSAP